MGEILEIIYRRQKSPIAYSYRGLRGNHNIKLGMFFLKAYNESSNSTKPRTEAIVIGTALSPVFTTLPGVGVGYGGVGVGVGSNLEITSLKPLYPQTVHSLCLRPVSVAVASLSITSLRSCFAVSDLSPHIVHSCQ